MKDVNKGSGCEALEDGKVVWRAIGGTSFEGRLGAGLASLRLGGDEEGGEGGGSEGNAILEPCVFLVFLDFALRARVGVTAGPMMCKYVSLR